MGKLADVRPWTFDMMQLPNASHLILAAMEDVFVDVSQNPVRRAFTNSEGIAKCIHTATSLYSYQRDGVILPLELLIFQGHSLDTVIPERMRPKQVHDVAGQAICLPCLGLIVAGMMLTVGL